MSIEEIHQAIINLSIFLKNSYFVILSFAISNSDKKFEGFSIYLYLQTLQVLENEN